MIISRNTQCEPVLAIFDEGDFSFQNLLQNTATKIFIKQEAK